MLKNKRNFFVLFILFLLLFVGGVFLWQKNQKDVAELNKNLTRTDLFCKGLKGIIKQRNKKSFNKFLSTNRIKI